MFPKQIPFVTTFLNGFVGSLPLINLLALTNWIVARPLPTAARRVERLDRLRRAGTSKGTSPS